MGAEIEEKDDKITKNSKKIKEIDVELRCCIFWEKTILYIR